MFRMVAPPFLVRLIELLLIIRREASLILSHLIVLPIAIRGRNRRERRVRRDAVALHDLFHVSCVFIYVVAIILGVCFLPLGVLLVEFILIVARQLIGISAIVIGPIVIVAVVVGPIVVARSIL